MSSESTQEEPLSEFLIRRSIPLRRLGTDLLPTAMASGCLAEYLDRRWLLTISHDVEDGGNWAVEVRFDVGKGALCYQLGQISFGPGLDLGYVEVPSDLEPRWQPSDDNGNSIADLPRELVTLRFSPPMEGEEFGFAGNVRPLLEKPGGPAIFATKQVAYPGLRYVGDDSEYHLFQLPENRPDGTWLKGTSGSPILDSSGAAVALVSRPGDTPDTIRGISLKQFEPLLAAA